MDADGLALAQCLMRIGALVLVLLLSGCSASAPEPDLYVPPEPEPDPVECLTVNEVSIQALRVGIKAIQDSNDVGGASAISIGADEWFVAAEITGPGLTDAVGVWWTQNDPSTAPGNAYNSVDGYAGEFSDYVRSPAYTSSSDGVDEVKGCL